MVSKDIIICFIDKRLKCLMNVMNDSNILTQFSSHKIQKLIATPSPYLIKKEPERSQLNIWEIY